MNLLEKYKVYIKAENLFQPRDKLLLAVSGGVDSVVLCELCKQAGYDFVIAHCNFQLRGEESTRDEQFVKELAKKYNAEALVKRFDAEKYAADNKVSIQVAARELRYQWFNELISNESLVIGHWVVTAHHLNDNVETMLMNFFKGTGINGLKAILPKQGRIVRPLLFALRKEIEQFAEENNLSWVEDSSNASDKYTRNYFRNKLIPGIKEVFPQVEENLANNLQRFREAEQLYQQAIDQHKKKLLELKGNEIHIPVLKLLKARPLHSILYEIIKDFGFTAHQTDDCIALLKSETGKYVHSHSHRIIRNRTWVIISPNQSTGADNILIEKEGNIDFTDGNLEIKKLQTTNLKLQTSNQIAQLDAKKLSFPLILRKWKQGDYFYPLGMNKKKKLSRFFIDQKLSLTQKEKTWVIEMNKKIIWVVGMRIDDRFKITDATKEILQITLINAK
jgi:tRNA(Ile)-lysidine synthase